MNPLDHPILGANQLEPNGEPQPFPTPKGVGEMILAAREEEISVLRDRINKRLMKWNGGLEVMDVPMNTGTRGIVISQLKKELVASGWAVEVRPGGSARNEDYPPSLAISVRSKDCVK